MNNDEHAHHAQADSNWRVASAACSLIELLRRLLVPDEEFGRKKFEDHRQFTAVVLGILALFLPMLWGWDHVTDPIGARNTVGLRLLFLLLFPLALGFWFEKARRRFLEVATPLTLLATEALFVEILNRLDTGMVFGLAGFMYCMYIAILAGQGLSLASGIGYLLGAAALPQIMAAFSLVPGFSQAHYSILIWPAAGLAILSQVVIAIEYLKRYRLEEQLTQLSDTDPLSGVGNRRSFMRVLQHERLRAQRSALPLSLLELDIDHFKRINDTHGHLVGDLVIRHMATLCNKGVRGIDEVARIGGEEFAILLVGTALEGAVEVAERIRMLVESSAISGPDNLSVTFTVSIGVTQLRTDDMSDLDLFGRVDSALYAAKAGGRNRVMSSE